MEDNGNGRSPAPTAGEREGFLEPSVVVGVAVAQEDRVALRRSPLSDSERWPSERRPGAHNRRARAPRRSRSRPRP